MPAPDGLYLKTWAALMAGTGLLVLVSRLGPRAAVWAMLVITPVKAALVFYVFMHLNAEDPLPRLVLLVALGTLIIFFALLFTDAAFR